MFMNNSKHLFLNFLFFIFFLKIALPQNFDKSSDVLRVYKLSPLAFKTAYENYSLMYDSSFAGKPYSVVTKDSFEYVFRNVFPEGHYVTVSLDKTNLYYKFF